MLEIVKVSKKFNENVTVKNISFTVNKGDILGFIGPNGAGKTTTMKIITGFLSPTEGEVIINGINIEGKPA